MNEWKKTEEELPGKYGIVQIMFLGENEKIVCTHARYNHLLNLWEYTVTRSMEDTYWIAPKHELFPEKFQKELEPKKKWWHFLWRKDK